MATQEDYLRSLLENSIRQEEREKYLGEKLIKTEEKASMNASSIVSIEKRLETGNLQFKELKDRVDKLTLDINSHTTWHTRGQEKKEERAWQIFIRYGIPWGTAFLFLWLKSGGNITITP